MSEEKQEQESRPESSKQKPKRQLPKPLGRIFGTRGHEKQK